MTTSGSDLAGVEGGLVSLTPEQLDELDAQVDSSLLRAGDEGWDDAVLVWNGMVATVPALVLQPPGAPLRLDGRQPRGSRDRHRGRRDSYR
jgi:hypothetical protein